MILEYQNDHGAIKKFSPVELPCFSVLTGVNGAGKTHLMNAIKEGSATCDSIPKHEISYFSYKDFLVTTSQTLTAQQIDNEKSQAWNIFNGSGQMKWRAMLQRLHNQHFVVTENGDQKDLVETHLPENTSLWEAMDPDLNLPSEFTEKVTSFIEAVRSGVIGHQNALKDTYRSSISKTIRKVTGPLHSVSEVQFKKFYSPTANQNSNHLSTSLGTIFSKYKIDQFLWVHDYWEKADTSVSKSELYAEYEHLNPQPWKVVNHILEEIHASSEDFDSFNFSITNPESDQVDTTNWMNYSFIPRLVGNDDGIERQFQKLSSGEQVLLALAVSIYESEDEFIFPKLLLLDAIDASLHPSMARALIDTITNVFVAQGTKVILATHSPSTVALAPEDSIFVVNKGANENKVIKTERHVAIEILTQGFMTLESGIPIFNELTNHKMCIITEGKNNQYIEKLLELHAIVDVGIVKGMESVTGSDQVKKLFNIFKHAPLSKPILFIWDCDVKSITDECGSLYTHAIQTNSENTVCTRGIENAFPPSSFDGFITETIDSRGHTTRTFDPKRKNDFLEKWYHRQTKTIFRG